MGETGYRAGAAEPAVWAAFFFVAAAVGGGSVVAGWGAGAVSELEPESTGGFAGGCKWVRRVDLDSLAHSSCRSIYRKQFGFMRRVVSTSPVSYVPSHSLVNLDLERSTQMFGQLADPHGANNPLSQVLYGLALR